MYSFAEFDDRREWLLSDYEVSQIHLDYRFGFDILGLGQQGGFVSVMIETPFSLLGNAGIAHVYPGDVASVGAALSILRQPVDKLVAYRDGLLEVSFGDGSCLRVERDSRFESWEARGEGELDGLALLCAPGPGAPWGE